MSNADAAISLAIEPTVTGRGYDLEDVSVVTTSGRSTVRITVDADQYTLDDLADLSRELSGLLDDPDAPAAAEIATALAAPDVTLEVTSPGVGRPLVEPRHWRRARGRKARVRIGWEELTAHVGGLSDDGRSVDLVVSMRGQSSVRTTALVDIESAVLDVDFAGPNPTQRRLCGLDPRGGNA